MRTAYILPLSAMLMLAACSSPNDEAEGDKVSAGDVADAAASLPNPMPGQYTTQLELVSFEAPGMPEQMRNVARSAVQTGLAEGNTFCLTPEEAEQGSKRMLEHLAESDCTYNKFDVAGGAIDADMSCKGDQGGVNRVKMRGTMTAQSSSITMDIEQSLPGGVGAANMTMKVDSQRTGACS